MKNDSQTSISRLPRPLGLTNLCKEYHQNGTDENKEKIYKFLITQYTLNGFRYTNISLSISEFSKIFKIEESTVLRQINELSMGLGSFSNPDQINNTLKSIASLSSLWAIQDKGLISSQIELLIKAQGNTYKPFISAELNKALKLGLDSNKNMMELYKTLSGQSQSILNIYNNNQTNNNFVTPEQALDFIEDKRKKERDKLKESRETYYIQDREDSNMGLLSPGPVESNILGKDTLDELFQGYRLGQKADIRAQSTEAQALYAPVNQGVTEPNLGPKAEIPLPEMAQIRGPEPYSENTQNTPIGPESSIPNIFKAPRKKGHNNPFFRRGEPEPNDD